MKEATVDIDGPVHLIDHGGDGPPMLLVHGLAGSHVDWRDVAPHLARGYHVHAVDLIGFGRTPLGDRQATVGDDIRLVEAVIERIGGGGPVTLVGNSMGGLISIVVAARRRAPVDALVLVDPALPRTSGGHLSMMLALTLVGVTLPGAGPALMNRGLSLTATERLVDNALKLCTVDVRRIDPETRRAHIELTEWRHRQDRPYAAFVEATRSLVRWLWDWDHMEKALRRVTVPTLLIHGARDRVVSVQAARRAAEIRPDWTLAIMEDTGHVPQMERPAEFMAIVDDWLRTTAPADEPRRPGARRPDSEESLEASA